MATSIRVRETTAEFGILLKRARQHRGLSQLALALQAGVSQRHVSFLESGRSNPSQEMIGKLSERLDLPLRLRNDLMVSAGFAPGYPARAFGDPDLAQVERVLDFMLERAEPYPGIVMDRLFNVVRANKGAGRFAAAMTDGAISALPQGINLVSLMLAPEGLSRYLVNGPEIAAHLLARLQPELLLSSPTSEAAGLAEKLQEVVETSPETEPQTISPGWQCGMADPVAGMHLRKDGQDIRLFSALSSFGTARDVTLQDLYIEHYFAADAATDAWIKRL